MKHLQRITTGYNAPGPLVVMSRLSKQAIRCRLIESKISLFKHRHRIENFFFLNRHQIEIERKKTWTSNRLKAISTIYSDESIIETDDSIRCRLIK